MDANVDRPLERILVVMDPTRMVQPALEKAEWIAGRNSAVLHLFCCIWDLEFEGGGPVALQMLEQTRDWLNRIGRSLDAKDIEFEVDVDWEPNWRERIAEVAREQSADLIVKTVARHSRLHRQLMRTSDWIVLRNSVCPTLLVDPERPPNPKIVLAAVKLRPNDETHSVLNERVVAMGHRLARVLDAELHAVTVYRGDDIYFDRQRFADSCELPRNRVHATDGSPTQGIAQIAEQIGADVLIVGCAANQVPERGIIIGDTAQRVIDEVGTDIVVVPAAQAAGRSAA